MNFSNRLFKTWLNRYSQVNWILADQIIVSGLNFLTGVLLARFLGVEGYGQFVLLYAILLYVNTLQFSLILAPTLSLAPQVSLESDRFRYLQGSLALQIFFSASLCIAIATSGSWILQEIFQWKIGTNLLSLAASIFCFQLQDWLRRYYFILQKGKSVFFNDFLSYGGQIFALSILYHFTQLTIVNAFWAIALTSASAFLIGVLTEKIFPIWADILPIFRKSWRFGRDLLLSGQVYWAGSQGILLFSASILGTRSIGGIRAAQNIVGPLNLLFQGMENIIPIQAGKHYAQKQMPGLISYLKKTSLIGGLLLAILCIAIALLSKELIRLAYGNAYLEFSSLIIWQVIGAFFAFFRLQAFYFFRTIGQTQEILFNTLIASFFAFGLTFLLVYQIQELGVVVAGAISELIGFVFALNRARKYRKLHLT